RRHTAMSMALFYGTADNPGNPMESATFLLPAAPHGLDPAVLIGVVVMLVVAKLGVEIFERMGQSSVLGELFGGVLIGNLVLLGFTRAEELKTNETIAA